MELINQPGVINVGWPGINQSTNPGCPMELINQPGVTNGINQPTMELINQPGVTNGINQPTRGD